MRPRLRTQQGTQGGRQRRHLELVRVWRPQRDPRHQKSPRGRYELGGRIAHGSPAQLQRTSGPLGGDPRHRPGPGPDGQELSARPGSGLARPGRADRRDRGQVRRRAVGRGAREHEDHRRPAGGPGAEDRRAAGGIALLAITTSYRTRSDAVPLRSFKAKGRPSAIAGVGVYAPEKIISNFDLEKMMDTSDKWITERTGIHRRHIAEPGTTTFEVATKAARAALDAAGITAKDLDMILVGTSSPDGPFPSVACRVQNELDAPGAVAWDTLAACTSFVYALSIADAYIATERADTVLVVGAEVLSRMLNYSDRGTAVIFGDGAGAAVVRAAPKGAGFLSWCLGSDGRGYAQVTAGNIEKGAYAAKDPAPFIDMVGPDVFKFAVDIFIRQANEVCEKAGVGLDQIDLWVPHQANFRIIDAAARRIGLPLERVAINIDEYGNTSSASIPLALEEAIRKGRVKKGDHVLLAGFGSGLTWGATLLKWM